MNHILNLLRWNSNYLTSSKIKVALERSDFQKFDLDLEKQIYVELVVCDVKLISWKQTNEIYLLSKTEHDWDVFNYRYFIIDGKFLNSIVAYHSCLVCFHITFEYFSRLVYNVFWSDIFNAFLSFISSIIKCDIFNATVKSLFFFLYSFISI